MSFLLNQWKESRFSQKGLSFSSGLPEIGEHQNKIYTNDLDTQIRVYGCSITDQAETRCLFNDEVTYGQYVFSSSSDYIECNSPENIEGFLKDGIKVPGVYYSHDGVSFTGLVLRELIKKRENLEH